MSEWYNVRVSLRYSHYDRLHHDDFRDNHNYRYSYNYNHDHDDHSNVNNHVDQGLHDTEFIKFWLCIARLSSTSR